MQVTIAGYYCRLQLQVTIAGYYCRLLLQVTIAMQAEHLISFFCKQEKVFVNDNFYTLSRPCVFFYEHF